MRFDKEFSGTLSAGIPNPCTTDERQSATCQNVSDSESAFQRVVMSHQHYQDVSGHYPALRRRDLYLVNSHALFQLCLYC